MRLLSKNEAMDRKFNQIIGENPLMFEFSLVKGNSGFGEIIFDNYSNYNLDFTRMDDSITIVCRYNDEHDTVRIASFYLNNGKLSYNSKITHTVVHEAERKEVHTLLKTSHEINANDYKHVRVNCIFAESFTAPIVRIFETDKPDFKNIVLGKYSLRDEDSKFGIIENSSLRVSTAEITEKTLANATVPGYNINEVLGLVDKGGILNHENLNIENGIITGYTDYSGTIRLETIPYNTSMPLSPTNILSKTYLGDYVVNVEVCYYSEFESVCGSLLSFINYGGIKNGEVTTYTLNGDGDTEKIPQEYLDKFGIKRIEFNKYDDVDELFTKCTEIIYDENVGKIKIVEKDDYSSLEVSFIFTKEGSSDFNYISSRSEVFFKENGVGEFVEKCTKHFNGIDASSVYSGSLQNTIIYDDDDYGYVAHYSDEGEAAFVADLVTSRNLNIEYNKGDILLVRDIFGVPKISGVIVVDGTMFQ